ncbi:MAG: Shikimate kinase [Chlamydiia bacterium]|nr:Shikimate kinase [Chlamydiia bacterium]
MSNIILIGFKSVGKTTIGRHLAAKHHMQFIDVDGLICKLTKDSTPRSCWNRLGEAVYRQVEEEVLLALPRPLNSVIATGGGTLENPYVLAHLSSWGQIVHLVSPPDVLRQRWAQNPLPTYESDFDTLYQRRTQHYNAIAHIIIDVHAMSHLDIMEEIYGRK